MTWIVYRQGFEVVEEVARFDCEATARAFARHMMDAGPGVIGITRDKLPDAQRRRALTDPTLPIGLRRAAFAAAGARCWHGWKRRDRYAAS